MKIPRPGQFVKYAEYGILSRIRITLVESVNKVNIVVSDIEGHKFFNKTSLTADDGSFLVPDSYQYGASITRDMTRIRRILRNTDLASILSDDAQARVVAIIATERPSLVKRGVLSER